MRSHVRLRFGAPERVLGLQEPCIHNSVSIRLLQQTWVLELKAVKIITLITYEVCIVAPSLIVGKRKK